MKKSLALIAAGSMLFALGACASSSKDARAAKPINARCPIQNHQIDSNSPVVTYKGHTIGLCCEDCIEPWNKLSAAEKDAKLAAMLAAAKK